MKKVHIQDLPKKGLTNEKRQFELRRLVERKKQDSYIEELNENNVYAKYVTDDSVASYPDNFIGAYMHAYNNHQDIILSVCDIWLQIQLTMAKYIDKNASILRDRIVQHDGRRKLVIYEYADNVDVSLLMEKRWEYFFVAIKDEMSKNTLNEVVDILLIDFSVATDYQKIFSTACVMSSFKQYFSYGRNILGCGICNVHLEGTRDDWLKLKDKIEKLLFFSIEGDSFIQTYVEKLLPLIDKFIASYDNDNEVDVLFWNTIMTTDVKRIGSGMQTQTTLEGWITYFSGIYTKIDFEDIEGEKLQVSVELENTLTNTKKKLELYGAFTGVVYDEKNDAYRPQIGLVLYNHDENFIKNAKLNEYKQQILKLKQKNDTYERYIKENLVKIKKLEDSILNVK